MPSEPEKAKKSAATTILIVITVAVMVAWTIIGTVRRYSPIVDQVRDAGAESDERNQLIEELADP